MYTCISYLILLKVDASNQGSRVRNKLGGNIWGKGGDGLSQGKPSSNGNYCVGWHPEVRKLDEEMTRAGGAARFFSDDGYILGPADPVFAAYLRFEAAIWQRSGLLSHVPTIPHLPE